MTKSNHFLAVVLCLVAGDSVHAQASVAFDVVSIRKNVSNQASWTMLPYQDGHCLARNITVRQLLGIAYRRDITLVFEGPAWLDSDHFDIEAKSDVRPDGDLSLLVQALLRERFRLQARLETRPIQMFALMRVRDSSDLRLAETRDCPAGDRPAPGCGGFQLGHGLDAQNVSMPGFAQWLTRMLGQFVFDQTKLTGSYDFKLPFNLERGPGGSVVGETGSILSGLSDLGLKLETTRIPLEVVVVEKIDRPSEN
jgi:uncharacterized protein (TIGR03435 family)